MPALPFTPASRTPPRWPPRLPLLMLLSLSLPLPLELPLPLPLPLLPLLPLLLEGEAERARLDDMRGNLPLRLEW